MTKHLTGELGGRHLTNREKQVMALLCGGHSNKEIAEILGISYETVKNNVCFIMGKLGARNRTHAVVMTLRRKEVAMPEKDLTRNLTRVIKSLDRLVQNVERDVRQIFENVHEVKESVSDIKHKLSHLQDDQEDDA